jgi:molybdopterin-guanine dinucleotide biosynthesis protein A
MGRDKSLLPLGGRPIIEHIAQQLGSRFRRVLLSTSHPQRYAFLDLRAVPDVEPGQGPPMGIASVLAASKSDPLFVTACDMPTIDGDLATRMLAVATHHDSEVPVTDGGWIEPLSPSIGEARCRRCTGFSSKGNEGYVCCSRASIRGSWTCIVRTGTGI